MMWVEGTEDGLPSAEEGDGCVRMLFVRLGFAACRDWV